MWFVTGPAKLPSELADADANSPPIPSGIYEQLITAELQRRLARQPDADMVPLPAGAQSLLARYVGAALQRARTPGLKMQAFSSRSSCATRYLTQFQTPALAARPSFPTGSSCLRPF